MIFCRLDIRPEQLGTGGFGWLCHLQALFCGDSDAAAFDPAQIRFFPRRCLASSVGCPGCRSCRAACRRTVARVRKVTLAGVIPARLAVNGGDGHAFGGFCGRADFGRVGAFCRRCDCPIRSIHRAATRLVNETRWWAFRRFCLSAVWRWHFVGKPWSQRTKRASASVGRCWAQARGNAKAVQRTVGIGNSDGWGDTRSRLRQLPVDRRRQAIAGAAEAALVIPKARERSRAADDSFWRPGLGKLQQLDGGAARGPLKNWQAAGAV